MQNKQDARPPPVLRLNETGTFQFNICKSYFLKIETQRRRRVLMEENEEQNVLITPGAASTS